MGELLGIFKKENLIRIILNYQERKFQLFFDMALTMKETL